MGSFSVAQADLKCWDYTCASLAIYNAIFKNNNNNLTLFYVHWCDGVRYLGTGQLQTIVSCHVGAGN